MIKHRPMTLVGMATTLILAGVFVSNMVGCVSTNWCLCPPDANGEAKGGAALWAENCTRCHNLRPAESLSDAEWDVAMMHMRVRANLTAVEQRKILEFLKSSN